MSGGGRVPWTSETVWNWGNNTGTAGGISSNYTIPSWQTNVSMALNNGSTVYRNFPDVAMTADAVGRLHGAGQPGTLTLRLGGAYGSTYVFLSATNLMFGPWAPVATNTLGVTGVWQFTDWQTTNYTERFYRQMLVQ